MSIPKPSQYECDNMQNGDIVMVQRRPFLYKWFRDTFQKDKIKIKIRPVLTSDDRIEVYQEDCTLVFSWEINGKSEYNDEVPYYIGYNGRFSKKINKLPTLQVGSENTYIMLQNKLSILIPTTYLRDAINKMDNVRNNIDVERQMQQAIKFSRYKGDFFKKRCKELNLSEWVLTYCSICGNSVKIKFDNDKLHIVNTCDCGNTQILEEDITWDTVAYLFNSQVQPLIAKKYKEFWKI